MSDPITVALYGGMGNQMFQYAMGRALSLRAGLPLCFDFYGFEFDAHYQRKFELDCFALSSFARARHPRLFRVARTLRRSAEIWPGISRLGGSRIVVEDSKVVNPGKLRAAGGSYVMGYWQNENHFSDVSGVIRADFSLSKGFTEQNRKIAEEISRCPEAVAIHVRRLHGVPASAAATTTGKTTSVLSLQPDYYAAAVKMLRSKLRSPEFFVFSDHPQWARESLSLDGHAHFLDNDRGPDREDMLLMARCRHHVVANSSFSWWGAWLAGHDGQIVIAPKGAHKYLPDIPTNWFSV